MISRIRRPLRARARESSTRRPKRDYNGELVPTEHALAAAENRTYEPASTLLERIKATVPTNGHASSKRQRRKKS